MTDTNSTRRSTTSTRSTVKPGASKTVEVADSAPVAESVAEPVAEVTIPADVAGYRFARDQVRKLIDGVHHRGAKAELWACYKSLNAKSKAADARHQAATAPEQEPVAA